MQALRPISSLTLPGFIRLVVITSALLLSAGCGGNERRVVTVMLFDTSGSTDTEMLRVRYAAVAARVGESLTGGDRIYGDRITAHSQAEASLPLSVHLPAFDPLSDNRLAYEREVAAARRAMQEQAAALLQAPPAPCTDLLNAFAVAAKVFGGATNATAEKRLVVASDMVQTCGAVDFTRGRLTEERIAEVIERERASGRLPKLTGVEIWVAGAGTDTRLSAERHQEIERFWQTYFTVAGADLAPERYGPTLLNWE